MSPGRSRKSAGSRRSMAAQAFTGDFLRGDRSKCRDSHGLLNACRSSELRLALRDAVGLERAHLGIVGRQHLALNRVLDAPVDHVAQLRHTLKFAPEISDRSPDVCSRHPDDTCRSLRRSFRRAALLNEISGCPCPQRRRSPPPRFHVAIMKGRIGVALLRVHSAGGFRAHGGCRRRVRSGVGRCGHAGICPRHFPLFSKVLACQSSLRLSQARGMTALSTCLSLKARLANGMPTAVPKWSRFFNR
jgi:hypothetical protein